MKSLTRKRYWLALWLLFAAFPLRAEQDFTDDKLRELAEPIALYPDVLIAQILPASTNPIQIIDAARYLQKAGGEVTEVPEGHDWHPSVVALLGVPPVLNMMNEQLSWTLELGEAVKNQREALMDAIQAARQEARDAGRLETNEQQIVVVERVVEREVIKIQPADPQVVYVPQYYPTSSTTVVYDANYDEAALVGLTVGLLFGAAIANADYAYVRWGRYGFYYDDDFYDDFLEDRYKYARDLQDRRFDRREELQEDRQDFIRERQDKRQESVGERRDNRRETIGERRDGRQTPRREEAVQRIQRDDERSRAAAERLERTTGGGSQRREALSDRTAGARVQPQARPTEAVSQRPAAQTRAVGRDQTVRRMSTDTPSRRSIGGTGTYSRQSAFGGSRFQGGSTRSFSQRGGRSLGGRSFGGRR